MSRRVFSFGAIGATALALVGCGGEKKAAVMSEAATKTPKPKATRVPTEVAECLTLAPLTADWIDSLLVNGRKRTGDYAAMSLKLKGDTLDTYKKLWLVAGTIDGQPGVWAINTITEDHGETFSINDLAKKVSTWFHGDNVNHKIEPEDSEIAAVVACLS